MKGLIKSGSHCGCRREGKAARGVPVGSEHCVVIITFCLSACRQRPFFFHVLMFLLCTPASIADIRCFAPILSCAYCRGVLERSTGVDSTLQGADVIYNEQTFPALVSTLSDRRLCSDKTLVYLATMLVCLRPGWGGGEGLPSGHRRLCLVEMNQRRVGMCSCLVNPDVMMCVSSQKYVSSIQHDDTAISTHVSKSTKRDIEREAAASDNGTQTYGK